MKGIENIWDGKDNHFSYIDLPHDFEEKARPVRGFKSCSFDEYFHTIYYSIEILEDDVLMRSNTKFAIALRHWARYLRMEVDPSISNTMQSL